MTKHLVAAISDRLVALAVPKIEAQATANCDRTELEGCCDWKICYYCAYGCGCWCNPCSGSFCA